MNPNIQIYVFNVLYYCSGTASVTVRPVLLGAKAAPSPRDLEVTMSKVCLAISICSLKFVPIIQALQQLIFTANAQHHGDQSQARPFPTPLQAHGLQWMEARSPILGATWIGNNINLSLKL